LRLPEKDRPAKLAAQFPSMKLPRIALVTLLLAPLADAENSPIDAALAASPTVAKTLPFDREVINRYSLDHLPRSLSIRQGSEVWLGFVAAHHDRPQALCRRARLTASTPHLRTHTTPSCWDLLPRPDWH
jgi:hypothetical protein